MVFEAILKIGGVPFIVYGYYTPFTVYGRYTPPEREFWRHGILDQAAFPDDVDLLSISLGDERLTQKQEDALIQKYGYSDFCEWLLDEGRKAFKDKEKLCRG